MLGRGGETPQTLPKEQAHAHGHDPNDEEEDFQDSR